MRDYRDNAKNKIYIIMTEPGAITIELTTEFTLIILLGEPLIRDGKRSTESNAGAKWFTCMCSSYPSLENFCGSESHMTDDKLQEIMGWKKKNLMIKLIKIAKNNFSAIVINCKIVSKIQDFWNKCWQICDKTLKSEPYHIQ